MSFYEENLKLFKDKIPMLYETVVNEKPIFNIGLESVNETFNYTIAKDDKKCFIHSVFDIAEEMKQMFRRVDKNANTLIIFGAGCGYALNYIKENFKSIKNILIIEPSLQIFQVLMKNVNIYNELEQYENVTFVVNKNENYVIELLFEYVKDKIAKSVNVVYNISYRTLFDRYYESINESIGDFINKTKINLVTNTYFQKQWTYNPIINMSNKSKVINDLFNEFKGKSAIIVSAGPSLNKNLHLLKYAEDKALIAAVGTASKILESNNIKPHFRFAMDSGETEKLIFNNLTKDDSILVYSDRVQYEVVPLFERRLKMILDTDNLTRYIYAKSNINFETISSGFSIANTALDVLIKLGMKNIIFLGQDLCYTKDKLYADGSWSKNDKINVNNKEYNYIKTKDIYGNDVYTLETFFRNEKNI
ncbi:motility associated factor glycosyltransferase family protein [Clostridium arbusti]|uniref:motility associated factor glycosyltransferase family protein n=1 Tax=Clostridium arbusti TaxID=1137848 RepID=UPI000287BE35|nr:6-hydroxymethylpterin diphosphokinase MptE-like protein [Clostridium arbusti]